MQRDRHSPEFQEQALSKARTRGKRTLESVDTELNMPLGTLKGWLKRSGLEGEALPHAATLPGDVPARQWSHAQRLLALQESHALLGAALHAWCREKGLFGHQLKQWRDAFCAPVCARRPNSDHRGCGRKLGLVKQRCRGFCGAQLDCVNCREVESFRVANT